MEGSRDGTGGGKVLGQVSLGALGQVVQRVGAEVIGRDYEIVTGKMKTAQGSLHREHSAVEGQMARGALEQAGTDVELAFAGGVEVGSVAGGDIKAAEIAKFGGGSEMERAGSSAELRAGLQGPAPAAILAGDEAGEIAELHSLPGDGGFHGGIAQQFGALDGGLGLDGSGIGDGHVGAHGPGF